MLRVLLMAILKKKDGAWVISIGFMAMIFVFIATVVNSTTVNGRPLRFLEEEVLEAVTILAIIGLLISVSTYLARNFARTNRALEAAKEAAETANAELEARNKVATQELQDARNMQMSLMPQSAPEIEGFDIAGICEPAADVGGDYFTYLWLDEAPPRPQGGPGGIALSPPVDGRGTQLGIVLMDVTGHGMKAATTTFLANGMLQSESRHTPSPSEIMAKMHCSLQETLPKKSFVATAFAHIDLREKTLTYFNAALPEPLLLRGGTPVELEVNSTVPLGCPLRAEFVGTTEPLRSGDVLLLFSDGLPEARNADEQEYEKVRWWNLLDSLLARPQPAQAWVDAIRNDVRAFTERGELEDDLTLVVVRMTFAGDEE